jgi:hypothetical protein
LSDPCERLTANKSIQQIIEVIDEDSKLNRMIEVLKSGLANGERGRAW